MSRVRKQRSGSSLRPSNFVASPLAASRGISLIEILVTLVILAVGLLGLAGLMLDGLRNNQSAYLRTQASILAYDMADRMRINRARAVAGAYDGYSTVGTGVVTTMPSCATSTSGCSPADQVVLDKAEWTLELQGGSNMVLLPGGVGTITRGSGNFFTISVRWQETQWDESAGERTAGAQQFSLDFSL